MNDIKCANGCGDVWERELLEKRRAELMAMLQTGISYRTWFEWDCAIVEQHKLSTPTGIKSEDIKPVEGVTAEDVEEFLYDLHERPPLPTSREWLEKDGERGGNNIEWSCSAVSRRGEAGHICGRTSGHSGHHTCNLIDQNLGGLHGRWYTDGDLVKAVK